MGFFGEGTFKIVYPLVGSPSKYSVEELRCRVESKSKAELFKIYDVEKEIYMNKFGNRWEYKIIIVNPTQEDLDSLDELNGKLVLFFPHIENFSAYECWLWYWYDDATPHKDRIYVNLIRRTLDTGNVISDVVVSDFEAYYPFTYGNLYDYSGNGNILTNNNASITNGVKSDDYNGGYSFNGIDSYMITQYDSDNYDSFTISFWVYTDGSTNSSGILQWASALTASTPFCSLQYESPDIRAYFNGSYLITETLPLDQWVFIALRRSLSKGSWVLTVNTTNYTELTGRTQQGDNIYIGNGYNGYMNMNVDNFRFYNRDLANEEITEIYNSEKE